MAPEKEEPLIIGKARCKVSIFMLFFMRYRKSITATNYVRIVICSIPIKILCFYFMKADIHLVFMIDMICERPSMDVHFVQKRNDRTLLL